MLALFVAGPLLSVGLTAALPSTPPLAREFIRGVNFAHIHLPGYGYGSERSKREIERLYANGVDWIAISPFAYLPKVDRPELIFGDMDPTLDKEALLAAISNAHRRGIKVLLKPHIWSGEFHRGKWNGDIVMPTPAEDARFFEQYTAFVLEYARVASAGQADALSIGLEYVQLTGPSHTSKWRALIAKVRALFRGPLTYGAHHEREVYQIEFWDQLDAIGVHGYYPLAVKSAEGDVRPEEVAAAWRPHLSALETLSRRFDRPIVFTELGYPAHSGALLTPWQSDSALAQDERLQAVAFQGTLAALGAAPFVRGVFIWKWFSGGAKNPAESDPYEPEDKEAEQVLRRWFRR